MPASSSTWGCWCSCRRDDSRPGRAQSTGHAGRSDTAKIFRCVSEKLICHHHIVIRSSCRYDCRKRRMSCLGGQCTRRSQHINTIGHHLAGRLYHCRFEWCCPLTSGASGPGAGHYTCQGSDGREMCGGHSEWEIRARCL